MGNTTLIELDHDRWNEIFESEESKQYFLFQLERQFSAFEMNGKDILGGKVLEGFHRSGIHYKNWMKCKEKMGWIKKGREAR
jgi:hypothetical protein